MITISKSEALNQGVYAGRLTNNRREDGVPATFEVSRSQGVNSFGKKGGSDARSPITGRLRRHRSKEKAFAFSQFSALPSHSVFHPCWRGLHQHQQEAAYPVLGDTRRFDGGAMCFCRLAAYQKQRRSRQAHLDAGSSLGCFLGGHESPARFGRSKDAE